MCLITGVSLVPEPLNDYLLFSLFAGVFVYGETMILLLLAGGFNDLFMISDVYHNCRDTMYLF